MKFSDYLLPGAFRTPKTVKALEAKLQKLRSQLQKARDERDAYKHRAQEAEQSLKKLTRLHMTDPYRCRGILDGLLNFPTNHPLYAEAGLLKKTSACIDVEDDMIWSDSTPAYFSVGLQALELVYGAVQLVPQRRRPWRILDLPCGHGRVMRWLRSCYPEAQLSGCDVQEHGMAFCEKEFASKSLPPAELPADLVPDTPFDVVWIGSLFTHLPRVEFDRFVQSLAKLLEAGGVVVFTTHGTAAWSIFKHGSPFNLKTFDREEMIKEHAQTGFTYAAYEHSPGYGVSFSTAEYVTRLIAGTGVLTLRDFKESGWASLQDVFVCQKAG